MNLWRVVPHRFVKAYSAPLLTEPCKRCGRPHWWHHRKEFALLPREIKETRGA